MVAGGDHHAFPTVMFSVYCKQRFIGMLPILFGASSVTWLPFRLGWPILGRS
jgi:hypothetical protein